MSTEQVHFTAAHASIIADEANKKKADIAETRAQDQWPGIIRQITQAAHDGLYELQIKCDDEMVSHFIEEIATDAGFVCGFEKVPNDIIEIAWLNPKPSTTNEE